jgi:hypothetical protein
MMPFLRHHYQIGNQHHLLLLLKPLLLPHPDRGLSFEPPRRYFLVMVMLKGYFQHLQM